MDDGNCYLACKRRERCAGARCMLHERAGRASGLISSDVNVHSHSPAKTWLQKLDNQAG